MHDYHEVVNLISYGLSIDVARGRNSETATEKFLEIQGSIRFKSAISTSSSMMRDGLLTQRSDNAKKLNALVHEHQLNIKMNNHSTFDRSYYLHQEIFWP